MLLLSGKIDKTNLKSCIKKLHVNYCHLSAQQMASVLKDCGKWSKEAEQAVKDVLQQCENVGCRKKGNLQKNPVSNFQSVKSPGELVAVDLKIRHGQRPILYCVDYLTGFCCGAILKDKSASEAAKGLWECWYRSGFPVIRTILSDNGREFVGADFQKFLERFGTRHVTTQPYHPESNGKIERVHYIIDSNIRDLMVSFPDLTEEEALIWSLTAYNNVETRHGFSPAHLMFGAGQGDTSVEDMGLGDCLGEDDERYVNLLKLRIESRLNHQRIKNDEKFRRFIARKSVPTPTEKKIGTWVWVCRPGQPIKGPGIVGRSIHSAISVKIGSGWLDCKHSDTIPLNQAELRKYRYLCRSEEREEPIVTQDYDSNSEIIQEYNFQERVEVTSQAEVRDQSQAEAGGQSQSEAGGQSQDQAQMEVEVPSQEVPEVSDQESQSSEAGGQSQEIQENGGQSQLAQVEVRVRASGQGRPEVREAQAQNQQEVGQRDGDTLPLGQASTATATEDQELPPTKGMFSKGDNIEIYVENQWRNVSIRSCYRKNPKNNTGSKYNLSFADVSPEDAKKSYVFDLDKIAWRTEEMKAQAEAVREAQQEPEVSGVKLVEQEEHDVLVTTLPYHLHGTKEAVEAKKKELDKLYKFGAFEDVSRKDLDKEQLEKLVATTWTIVLKPGAEQGKTTTKARLCARGDREIGNFRTDSPTCAKSSLRLGLAIAATKGWKICSLDFTSAFIQGQDIDREVYLLPPPEIRKDNPDLIWRVLKRVYGFRDAPRGWYLEVDESLRKLGCVKVQLDNAFYLYFSAKTGELFGYILSHVDDFLYGGEPEFHKIVIGGVKSKYVIGACEESHFSFTGWNLHQDSTGITVTQKDYLAEIDLSQFDALVNAPGNNDEKLDEEQTLLLQKANGILGWLAQVSKPNLSYQYVEFSSLVRKATIGDAKRLIRTLKKAQAELDVIKFSNLGDISSWKIKIYCDASFAKLNNHDTVLGDLVTLEGAGGAIAILEWSSNKSKIPSNSPLNGESEAAMQAQGKISYYRHVLKQIFGVNLPGVIVTDSKSLRDAVYSDNPVKDKRTAINITILRSVMQEDDISVEWLSGKTQPADLMTKPSVNPVVVRTLMSTGNSSCLSKFETYAEKVKSKNFK